MNSGLMLTFIQPNFMQNLLWSADAIKARGELYSTLGVTLAGHVDARDIASVIAATLTEPIDRHAGRIHLVTGPAPLLKWPRLCHAFSGGRCDTSISPTGS